MIVHVIELSPPILTFLKSYIVVYTACIFETYKSTVESDTYDLWNCQHLTRELFHENQWTWTGGNPIILQQPPHLIFCSQRLDHSLIGT